MAMTVAQWIVYFAMAYAGIGLLFAIAFVLSGVERLDPSAKGAPAFFRVLIFPGAAALWPLLLSRWLRGQTRPPAEQNAHRRLAKEER